VPSALHLDPRAHSIILSFNSHSKGTAATVRAPNMSAASTPASATSDAIHAWEKTLSRQFKRWNDERIGEFAANFLECISTALNHSLSPFTAAQGDYVITSITERFPTDMDFNQWYDMLREGRWYDVVEQILPMKKGTLSYATGEDWEIALRRRFTGWKVDMSGDDSVKKVLGPCVRDRILRALEIPGSPLTHDQRDTVGRVVGNMDEKTITVVFDMLKAGDWLEAIRSVLPLSPYDEDITIRSSLRDIMKHWDDDFQGGALVALLNRLRLAEKNFGRAENTRTANKGASQGQYAKTLDIVQSSGMGKSRLVSEMAKKLMSVTFVLRKPGETGFPPGDTEVFNFLMEGNSNSMQHAHTNAMCLLGGTFFVSEYTSVIGSSYQADVIVANWCKSKSTSDGKKLDFAALLEKWNHSVSPVNTPFMDETNRRNPIRVKLYESIIKQARKYRNELQAGIVSNRKMKSSGSEPVCSDLEPETSGSDLGRTWDWSKDLVCLCALYAHTFRFTDVISV